MEKAIYVCLFKKLKCFVEVHRQNCLYCTAFQQNHESSRLSSRLRNRSYHKNWMYMKNLQMNCTFAISCQNEVPAIPFQKFSRRKSRFHFISVICMAAPKGGKSTLLLARIPASKMLLTMCPFELRVVSLVSASKLPFSALFLGSGAAAMQIVHHHYNVCVWNVIV